MIYESQLCFYFQLHYVLWADTCTRNISSTSGVLNFTAVKYTG